MPTFLLPRLHRSFHSRLWLSVCVPTVLIHCSTGISTCYPSTTSFDLALGPDLPRADQLYSGNLGYSAGRILTFLSLLIPAFSLHSTPQLLIGTASARGQCSSTNSLEFLSFGVVFQPRTFSAQDLSTSAQALSTCPVRKCWYGISKRFQPSPFCGSLRLIA